MQAFANYQELPRPRRPSLVDTIGGLHHAIAEMRQALGAARREVGRLRQRFARQQAQMPLEDIAGLRRQVAFFCHPDRGGDTDLMSRLNLLFDMLEETQDPAVSLADEENVSC